MKRARLHASWAAALVAALALSPWPAAAKCAPDPIRVYPAGGQQDVPVDAAFILELPAGHPVLQRLLRGDALRLLDPHGAAVALRPVRHRALGPGARPARTMVELHPATELQPGTEFQVDWRGWRDVPGDLRSYRFATGSRRSARIPEPPGISMPVLWVSKPGCGALLAFSVDVLGRDPTGVHEVEIAATSAALSGEKLAGRALLGSFLELQAPGRLTIGTAACRSNHRFGPGWRGWARVRVLAENGDPGPWSEPFELDADAGGPHAQRTCPPRS